VQEQAVLSQLRLFQFHFILVSVVSFSFCSGRSSQNLKLTILSVRHISSVVASLFFKQKEVKQN
jgi:hypothetical protein